MGIPPKKIILFNVITEKSHNYFVILPKIKFMEKSFTYQIRTRYSETDQMGVIYYGNYPQYLEIARVEWLRNLGISYKEMEERGIMLPVVSLQINYKKPALYDELLSIEIQLKTTPTSKIEFDYQIYNQTHELIATAYTALVFVSKETFRPIKCPDFVLEKL